VLIVTTDHLPGYEIRQLIGEVVWSEPRTSNPFREGVKNIRGGDYDPKAPENLTRWRMDAVVRLGEEARRLGANAVVGMRFDCRRAGETWVEICAYGTAVIAAQLPVPPPRPDTPVIAAETAQPGPIKHEPAGVAAPASAPEQGTSLQTPTPRD